MTQTTQANQGTAVTEDIWFYYDASGTPCALKYQDEYFYYATNAQGDVTGILNSSGNEIATYTYDAWGNPLAASGTHALANLNPLRYRGYVYDQETELYYLQSRYYNPEVGRFLNPDIYTSTGQGLLGNNMFAYCVNNPVNCIDSTGCFPEWIKNAIDWVENNIVEPIRKFVEDISEDIDNYDVENTDEDRVFSANYFSGYKGSLVLFTPFDASFSYGIIGLSSIQKNPDTLNHEYGHTVQLSQMGIVSYTINVAIPSVTINILDRMGKLPYDYYGAPWEAEADRLGGVNRSYGNTVWPEGAYESYFDLIKWFFE